MSYTLALAVCAGLLALSTPYATAQAVTEIDTEIPGIDDDAIENWAPWLEWDSITWTPWLGEQPVDGEQSTGTDGPGGETTTPGEPITTQPSSRSGKGAHARSSHAHASRSGAHVKAARARAAPRARKSASRAGKTHKA